MELMETAANECLDMLVSKCVLLTLSLFCLSMYLSVVCYVFTCVVTGKDMHGLLLFILACVFVEVCNIHAITYRVMIVPT